MFVRVKKKTFEKGKKMRITESTGTQTYGGLGGCELDTGGRAARRIDCSWTVQIRDMWRGRGNIKKRQKNANHGIGRNSNVWRIGRM